MEQVLKNIRVLDFSRVFAAPDATQTLGDLGAEVVKIENPKGGDDCRYLGITSEALDELGGPSPSFRAFNRNKKSICIDLATTAGQEVARSLALKCDVMVNNFRPGTMQRFGLDYETLSAQNPGLVYCDFTAYGSKGDLAPIGANDLALQAHSGLMSITGEEDGDPVRAGSAIIDLHASLAIVSGVLAALLHRTKTGRGQHVETSLLMSSAHLMSYFYQDYWLTGHIHRPMGTANHLSVPNQAFPATDGHVIIIAPSDEMWRRCAHALDAEQLDRPEFAKASDRLRLRKSLVPIIAGITSGFTKQELHNRLSAAKVNVSIVHDISEAARHEQLEAIGGIFHHHNGSTTRNYVATPFSMSETPGEMRSGPPELGQDTAEVMRNFGYEPEEIEKLRSQGAFGRNEQTVGS